MIDRAKLRAAVLALPGFASFRSPVIAGISRAAVLDLIDKAEPLDDLAGEYGRLLAERDRLIADGVDPADLELPRAPDEP